MTITLSRSDVTTAIAVPDPIRSATAGYAWTPVTDGESGGAVFRLATLGRPTLYLKCGAGRVADDITAEFARLEWLAGRLPVPSVVHFVRSPGDAYLLTTAVPGKSADDYFVEHPGRRPEIVVALAGFLRVLHALPPAECPFNAGHELRMADARRNVDTGRVPTADFDEAHEGWTPAQVWDEMMALLPLTFGRVVTHGDFSLGNVLLEGGRVTGCIDVGRAGVADPYQDLAILWHNLGEFGPDLQRVFWRAYGVAEPDARKLRFHLCLDEFF